MSNPFSRLVRSLFGARSASDTRRLDAPGAPESTPLPVAVEAPVPASLTTSAAEGRLPTAGDFAAPVMSVAPVGQPVDSTVPPGTPPPPALSHDEPPATDAPAFDADLEAVARALEALLSTESWEQTHVVLERLQALLLTRTADVLLVRDTAQARQVGDDRRAGYLELHRTLLSRCRESSVAEAWVEFEIAQVGFDQVEDADPAEAARALTELINAGSWDEKRAALEHDEALLVSDTALRLLASNIKDTEQQNDVTLAWMLRLYRGLMHRTRQLGWAMAWADFDAVRHAYERVQRDHLIGTVLDDMLLNWLNLPIYRDRRRFLEAHAELLDPECDILLQALIYQEYGQSTKENDFRDCLLLLRDIRTRTTNVGAVMAIREGCVNAYGGLVLDQPPWLAYIDLELARLQGFGRASHAARTSLLREAIARAENDPTVAAQGIAELQMELGAAEAQDSRGSRDAALEAAIDAFAASRNLYTFERYPRQYAQVQHNQAIAYRLRVTGTRRDNIEKAIALLQEALHVRTLRDFPEDYAGTHNSLAGAFADRIEGSRRKNLEQALGHAWEALRVFAPDASPERYAVAQVNLANIYQRRLAGSRRENVKRAMFHARAALRICTPTSLPEQYAAAHTSLAAAYLDRVEGSRRDNLMHAIGHAREALRVLHRETAPREYAMAQATLADAYQRHLVGNRRDNIEQAIANYEEALCVFTGENSPWEHGMLQNSLAAAYADRIADVRRKNLERAIVHAQAALRVLTPDVSPREYAMVQHNLGYIYERRERGSRQRNLERAIAHYQEAAHTYQDHTFTANFRNTQLNLAWLYLGTLSDVAKARDDTSGARVALASAHDAYSAARVAQAELGWLESDERGRASLQGEYAATREMYARDAWCLWNLGRPKDAIVALEAGRAQALAEAQAIRGAELEDVCPEHLDAFSTARGALQDASAAGDQMEARTARDALLHAREAIRSHCQPNFLPGEPTYAEIAGAAPDQALVYIAATDFGGLCLIVPPLRGQGHPDEQMPVVLELPALTWQAVDDWLMRRDAEQHVVGGYRLALDHQALPLLVSWLRRSGGETGLERLLTLPLRDVAEELETKAPALTTLRQAFERLVQAWRDEADLLSGETGERQQAQVRFLRDRLGLPLGEALAADVLVGELDWFFMEAELDAVLPTLATSVMQPLRERLDALGLDGLDQSVAVIACGRLGALPLHAALVHRAAEGRGDKEMPFQETCALAYQANARTLAAARAAAERLAATAPAGPFLTVGDPQPTSQHALGWAEAEAQAVAELAVKAGRRASAALLQEEASREAVLKLLRATSGRYLGAWVEIASHGYADPADLGNCYMLLAGDERLTLADLQREQLLAGVRCFNASGCVTALGDLETAPDELSSFAAGALQAGAASAIATQWPVNDRATFLLMLKFAHLVLRDPTLIPAQALPEAARWLREATWNDLDDLARRGLAGLSRRRGGPVGNEWEPAAAGRRTVRDTVRGVMPTPLAEDTGAEAQAEEPELDAEIPESLRMAAGEALKRLRATVPAGQRGERPFAHPIYWACAVVFGA